MLSIALVTILVVMGAVMRYRKAFVIARLLARHENTRHRLADLRSNARDCNDSDYPHALREIERFERLSTKLYNAYVTVVQSK